MKHSIKQYHYEIGGIITCLGLGMISGYLAHAGDSLWYASLQKPSFNPPSWIFAPVWTALYIMMGIALGRLWKSRARNKEALMFFAIQFMFNLLWSPLFFYAHRIDLAFYDICLLLLNLIACIMLIRKNDRAALLLVPYVAWVSFALVLNANIYLLN